MGGVVRGRVVLGTPQKLPILGKTQALRDLK